jgi:hypothetical protein
MVPRRSLSLARMAVFMSSVICSLRVMVLFSLLDGQKQKPRQVSPARLGSLARGQ